MYLHAYVSCGILYHTQSQILLLLSLSLSLSQGGDLDAKICQWRELKRTFEETLILDWFIQLTTAIKYIHDRRILHRDLKARYQSS